LILTNLIFYSIGRKCLYLEDSFQLPNTTSFQPLISEGGGGGESPNSLTSPSPNISPGLGYASVILDLSHLFCNALRQPMVDDIVRTQARVILQSFEKAQVVTEMYFNTIYERMPVISKKRFLERLPSLLVNAPADFVTLCLCMLLIQQHPVGEDQSMQSSLYATVKSMVSLLESAGYLSLYAVQCRLLIAFYEIGHGIYPAASISIGACVKISRSIGIHRSKAFLLKDNIAKVEREEERRVWWAVVNLDRFASLYNGGAFLDAEDPKTGDLLPVDDQIWAENLLPEVFHTVNLTPSYDPSMGAFARECQVSHLAGQILRHVFDLPVDPETHESRGLQLEQTLLAFVIPMVKDHRDGVLCTAVGISSSALFMLFDSSQFQYQNDETRISYIINHLDVLSLRIAEYAARLFYDEKNIAYEFLSPFLPHALYQAAVMQFRLWKQTNELRYKEQCESLKTILMYYSRRWLVAEKYLRALQRISGDWPRGVPPPDEILYQP
ncbi:hypothetical protein F5884DRAFT_345902, partial [Xylogone sp. PMI_703]